MLEIIMELNSHGVNKAIKAYILSDEGMRSAGFRIIKGDNQRLDYWYYYCLLKLPEPYSKSEISFSVSIPIDKSDIRIDVLDEDFLQPYDYQHYLENIPYHTFAGFVKLAVEKQLERLQDLEILSGHKYGDYI